MLLSAQEVTVGDGATPKEIVATTAAGRVIFCVAHDAIIVAAVPSANAPGSVTPAVIPLSSDRVGVLLGAITWTPADTTIKPTRFEAEMPTLATNSTRRASNSNPNEASDIEDIGIGLLEPLRAQVTQIHHKLDLAADEPIVQLLVADYVPEYGAEIWSLQYRVRQQNLGNDYWETTLLRPAYYQLYPPEKTHPGILVEVQYPPKANPQPTLAELLSQHNPQLEILRTSQDFSLVTTAILAAKSKEAQPAAAADFIRTAFPLVAGGQSQLVMAQLDAYKGFQWILPPKEPLPPPSQTREAPQGAPSLRKYIPPDKK